MKVGLSLFLSFCAWVAPSLTYGEPNSTSQITAEIPLSRKWTGEWNFALLGISTQEGKDAGGAAALYVSSRFDYRFKSWLHARVSPSLSLFSSRMQERFDDDAFQNRIWLTEGYLGLIPIEYFELRAGAVNQRYHGTSLLVSGHRAFPGMQEIGRFNPDGKVRAEVVFQQAIPTSHSLNTERERQEELPQFTTETLLFKGEHFDWFKWKAAAGHFRWSNLPSKVAFESRRIGNVGFGENVTSNRFAYAHEGFYGATEFCYCPRNSVSLYFEFERLHNTEAPGDAADAQLWGLGPKVTIGEVELDFRYRRFFLESDATVAYYNRSRFGNTNRIGHNLEAVLHFKKDNFSIFAEAYLAEPINRDPNQRDLTLLYLGVETDYAKF